MSCKLGISLGKGWGSFSTAYVDRGARIQHAKDQRGIGIINHSCSPNVRSSGDYYYALREIQPDEEILMSYYGDIIYTYTRDVRRAAFNSEHRPDHCRFLCTCEACKLNDESSAREDRRRQKLSELLAGARETCQKVLDMVKNKDAALTSEGLELEDLRDNLENIMDILGQMQARVSYYVDCHLVAAGILLLQGEADAAIPDMDAARAASELLAGPESETTQSISNFRGWIRGYAASSVDFQRMVLGYLFNAFEDIADS